MPKRRRNQAGAVVQAAVPLVEKGVRAAAEVVRRRGIARTASDIEATARKVKARAALPPVKANAGRFYGRGPSGKPLLYKKKKAMKIGRNLEKQGHQVTIFPIGKKWAVRIENPAWKGPRASGAEAWDGGDELYFRTFVQARSGLTKREVMADIRHDLRLQRYLGNFLKRELDRRWGRQNPDDRYAPDIEEVTETGIHLTAEGIENPLPKGWDVIDSSSGVQVAGPFETEQQGWEYVTQHGGPDALSVEPIEGMYANPEDEEDIEEFERKFYPQAPGERENPREDSIYDLVGGCPKCPYMEECVRISGCGEYTMDDEYGTCPPALIARYRQEHPTKNPSAEDLKKMSLRTAETFLTEGDRLTKSPAGKALTQMGQDSLRHYKTLDKMKEIGWMENPGEDIEGLYLGKLLMARANPEEQSPPEVRRRIEEIGARISRGEITHQEGVTQAGQLLEGGSPSVRAALAETMLRVPSPAAPQRRFSFRDLMTEAQGRAQPGTTREQQAQIMRTIMQEHGVTMEQLQQQAMPHAAYHVKYTKIKPAVVKIVRDFIVRARPWRGTAEEKQAKFERCLQQLSEAYGMRVPTLHISDPEHAHGSGFSDPQANHIELPHYSVVTFLHEFKHIMQAQLGHPQNEEVARGWSISLFYKAAPKHFKKAVERAIIFFITPEDIPGHPEPMLFAYAESPTPTVPIMAPLKARLEEMGYRTDTRDGPAKLRRDGAPEAAKLLYTNAPGFVTDRALKYHLRVPDDTYRGEVEQSLMSISAKGAKGSKRTGRANPIEKVKGVGLTSGEYHRFVDYLNENRIQKFARADVLNWLEHDYASRGVSNPRRRGEALVRGRFEIRPGGKYIRERVEDESRFDRRSFKTIRRGQRGHSIVIGCPVGQWDPENRRCRVGTRAQSILHPLTEAERYGFSIEQIEEAGITVPPEVIEVLENPDPYYYSAEAVAENPDASSAVAEIAGMAATGATVGSIVPGVGTAIGAAAGAGVGAAKQAAEAIQERRKRKKEAQAAAAAAAKPATQNPDDDEAPEALLTARDLM
jgi:hypothetical protein